jgi:hypothetical protein
VQGRKLSACGSKMAFSVLCQCNTSFSMAIFYLTQYKRFSGSQNRRRNQSDRTALVPREVSGAHKAGPAFNLTFIRVLLPALADVSVFWIGTAHYFSGLLKPSILKRCDFDALLRLVLWYQTLAVLTPLNRELRTLQYPNARYENFSSLSIGLFYINDAGC